MERLTIREDDELEFGEAEGEENVAMKPSLGLVGRFLTNQSISHCNKNLKKDRILGLM